MCWLVSLTSGEGKTDCRGACDLGTSGNQVYDEMLGPVWRAKRHRPHGNVHGHLRSTGAEALVDRMPEAFGLRDWSCSPGKATLDARGSSSNPVRRLRHGNVQLRLGVTNWSSFPKQETIDGQGSSSYYREAPDVRRGSASAAAASKVVALARRRRGG